MIFEVKMKQKKLTSALLLICIIASSLSLVSCGNKKEKFTTHSLDYFDTATTIAGYESDRESFDEVSAEIVKLLGEYHRLYTIYYRYDGMENLCTINELVDGAHRKVTVDSRIIDMLSYAKQMYTLTDGRLNIAMGSVLSIWHSYRTAGLDEPAEAELPPTKLLEEAALHTNIDDLIIDEKNSTVFIKDPKMTLDVGAIAKGYAVEMIAQELEARGITGYVLNVGGNVRTIGTKPDGEKWLAGIENPDTDAQDAYVEYLNLAGESIVTSGSYQRYYIVDGKNYHHIIDPQTLMPSDRYLSVSIVCNNSALGDALSTALFCMELDAGLALIESISDAEAMWILPDGSKQISSGFSAYVTTI